MTIVRKGNSQTNFQSILFLLSSVLTDTITIFNVVDVNVFGQRVSLIFINKSVDPMN